MSALDTSVVNSVIPIITQDLNSQVEHVEWIVIIYLLVISGLLPPFGRLGDMRGHRRVYLAGFMVFIVSSLLCVAARSVQELVFFRGIQALGTAMLSANSPAILTKSFPANQRGQALGLQATMTYSGLVAGPILGGWLTDFFGWRSVFFINLPVGLAAFLLSMRYIPQDVYLRKDETFDIPGGITFLVGLTAFLFVLNQGQNWNWAALPVLSGLATAAVFLSIFVWVEKRSASPMLDLSLFANSRFSASIAAAVLNYICVYSVIFLMPFFLINGRGLSPSQSGVVLSIQPVVMAVIAPISGTLSDRIGARLPTSVGMFLLACGLVALSMLGAGTPFSLQALALALCGLGIGVFISPNNSALMGSAPHRRQGIAAGMMATARNVGMVLGVGLAGAVFTTVLGTAGLADASKIFIAIRYSFLAAAAFAFLGSVICFVPWNSSNDIH